MSEFRKVILQFGYDNKFVMDSKQAVAVLEAIGGAEKYEDKYHSASEGCEAHYSYHIYPTVSIDNIQVLPITEHTYNIARMAGTPEEND